MTKSQQKQLERLQKLLETNTSRAWADILSHVNEEITSAEISKFRRDIKRTLVRETKKREQKLARLLASTKAKARTVPELRAMYYVDDIRPQSRIPEGKEFSNWLRIIGRSAMKESVPRRSAPDVPRISSPVDNSEVAMSSFRPRKTRSNRISQH